MAGGGESVDNPVGINVVPMVDVIFCLCVFFLCSYQVHESQGRFEAWLPKDLGTGHPPSASPPELRVALYWDQSAGRTSRRYGTREIPDPAALEALLRAAIDDYRKAGHARVPLIVDGDARVPWRDVVEVLDAGRSLDIDTIQFATGAEGS